MAFYKNWLHRPFFMYLLLNRITVFRVTRCGCRFFNSTSANADFISSKKMCKFLTESTWKSFINDFDFFFMILWRLLSKNQGAYKINKSVLIVCILIIMDKILSKLRKERQLSCFLGFAVCFYIICQLFQCVVIPIPLGNITKLISAMNINQHWSLWIFYLYWLSADSEADADIRNNSASN